MNNLRAENLVRRFAQRTVVNDVSISISPGEIVGLLGPNGAGKTTTFNMITGFLRPNNGDVYLGNEKITNFPMYQRSRKGVGYLSQESSIFRGLTVRQNIALVVERLGLSKAEQRKKIQRHLEDLNLVELQNQKAISLSGGERRRTEVARALATNPNFLLLDEPFVGIDPITAEELQNIIHDLKRQKIGVLITDHNVHETLAITDRAYLLVNGKIMREGTGEALASDEMVKQQYLGKNFTLAR